MFSGIVEAVGTLAAAEATEQGARLRIRTPIAREGVALGESVCVNGACLTVAAAGKGDLVFDVSAETLRRTNLAELKEGDSVNLERSVRVSDRLSGHIVFGHVDGVGEVKEIRPEGDSFLYKFAVAPELGRYLVEKGSVAVDGISLTVFDCRPGQFTVAIIPHTHQVTTLKDKKPGAKVNIETDMLGKYVERFVGEQIRSRMDPMLQELAGRLADIARRLREIP